MLPVHKFILNSKIAVQDYKQFSSQQALAIVQAIHEFPDLTVLKG